MPPLGKALMLQPHDAFDMYLHRVCVCTCVVTSHLLLQAARAQRVIHAWKWWWAGFHHCCPPYHAVMIDYMCVLLLCSVHCFVYDAALLYSVF